jgi:hypothetical protein
LGQLNNCQLPKCISAPWNSFRAVEIATDRVSAWDISQTVGFSVFCERGETPYIHVHSHHRCISIVRQIFIITM